MANFISIRGMQKGHNGVAESDLLYKRVDNIPINVVYELLPSEVVLCIAGRLAYHLLTKVRIQIKKKKKKSPP